MSELNEMPDLSSFWKDQPTRLSMYQCPACHETISADAAACRFCHLAIDARTAQTLLAKSQHVTNVITQANTFSVATSIAVLIALGGLYYLFVEHRLGSTFVGAPVIAIAYGGLWLFRNRSLVTADPDFPAAVRKVKRTMLVAAAVLFLQLATYLAIR
jgi:hypothetical protein